MSLWDYVVDKSVEGLAFTGAGQSILKGWEAFGDYLNQPAKKEKDDIQAIRDNETTTIRIGETGFLRQVLNNPFVGSLFGKKESGTEGDGDGVKTTKTSSDGGKTTYYITNNYYQEAITEGTDPPDTAQSVTPGIFGGDFLSSLMPLFLMMIMMGPLQSVMGSIGGVYNEREQLPAYNRQYYEPVPARGYLSSYY
jgi:hypothetical protein